MEELWQLYNEQGLPIDGKGATKQDTTGKALLHAASHVWIWRKGPDGIEVLLQKRAPGKPTWPNCYDISAAGHVDLGETPLAAALREAKEEINLDINESSLRHIGVHRAYLVTPNGLVENEFQWLYLLELPSSVDFALQKTEVASVAWKPLEAFKRECSSDQYVPHSDVYYQTVIQAIEHLQTV